MTEADYLDELGPHALRAEEKRLRSELNAVQKLMGLLYKGIHQLASECAECEGTGTLRGEHGFEESCPECDDIRTLLK